MKHTQGPWKFWNKANLKEIAEQSVAPEKDATYGKGWTFKKIHIGDDNETVLAEVMAMTTGSFLHNFEEWEANAKLIAAAPELLEALQECVKELHFHNWQHSSTCYAAEAAIKKATE